MSLRIRDLAHSPAQRHLTRATLDVSRSMRRLSSGLRIDTAADDPGGLAMSERLRARVRSYDQARRNAADGVSMLQVADGALGTVSDLLVRMRELAVGARNGTNGKRERQALDEEYRALRDEIARVEAATTFGDRRLLDGSSRAVQLQVGVGTRRGVDTIQVDTRRSLTRYLGVSKTRVSNEKVAGRAVDRLDRAIERLGAMRGRFGAVQQRLTHTIANLTGQFEAASAAESRVRDVDYAAETARLTRGQILQSSATAVLAQANSQPALVLRLLGS